MSMKLRWDALGRRLREVQFSISCREWLLLGLLVHVVALGGASGWLLWVVALGCLGLLVQVAALGHCFEVALGIPGAFTS